MKNFKLKDFTRGWIVGDFEPTILPTKNFEFAVRYYRQGDKEQKHVHKVADEISVVISGRFRMNDQELVAGDIVHLSPGEPADYECLEDGVNAVVKSPSVKNDKFIIN